MKKIVTKTLIICMFFAIIFANSNVQAITIVLDPGHGGTDPGASAQNGEMEKDLTMKVANYLKEYLEPYDATVLLTHGNITEKMKILDRALFIRKQKADIAISLHFNSETGTPLKGAEVWVTKNSSLPQYNANSTALGNEILKNLNALGIQNRGVKTNQCTGDSSDVYSDGTRADYYGIIRYCMRGCSIDYGVIKPEGAIPANIQNGEGIPAIIVEHCFVKGDDYKFINSDAKLKAIAEADGKAIVDYYHLQLKKIREALAPFIDVFIDDWYADAVKYVYNNNIIKGYNDTEFAPNDKLTRGMMVTILYRMEGSPSNDGKSKFSDVDVNQYYAKAVKWAVDSGIIHGYEGVNKFGPDDKILRQDLAGILRNYAKYKEKDTNTTADLTKFKDYKNVDSYANTAVQWAVGKGVITGNDNGTLNPKGNTTRAEAAAMMYKYCKKIGR